MGLPGGVDVVRESSGWNGQRQANIMDLKGLKRQEKSDMLSLVSDC